VWFLVFFLVVSVIGVSVILVRNRKPVSMEHSIEEFGRSLRALAPETPEPRRGNDPGATGAG
jgi:hypothetical protein